MSRYQVDKLLRDLRRDHQLLERFQKDAEQAMEGYRLDLSERQLLKRWDVRELYDRGANPLLLLLAHGASGRRMQDYIALMGARNREGG